MTTATWTCPTCRAPFVAPNASRSCVSGDLEAHFAAATPGVRRGFERLVDLAQADGSIPVVAQKTGIVLAAPIRLLAIHVRRDRLTGHLLLEAADRVGRRGRFAIGTPS